MVIQQLSDEVSLITIFFVNETSIESCTDYFHVIVDGIVVMLFMP